MLLGDVKDYLRVDYDDDDTLIKNCMEAAESYIIGAVGGYDDDNPKANFLYMAIVQDLYDNRAFLISEQQKKRISYTFSFIILQIRNP